MRTFRSAVLATAALLVTSAPAFADSSVKMADITIPVNTALALTALRIRTGSRRQARIAVTRSARTAPIPK